MNKVEINRGNLLREFAERIKKTYGGISLNISDVVEALNSNEKVDEGLKKHIEKIIASLVLLEQKILVEKKLTDKQTLHLLNRKINNIKSLRSYLVLAERKPDHSIIVAIDRLNNSLLALFAEA